MTGAAWGRAGPGTGTLRRTGTRRRTRPTSQGSGFRVAGLGPLGCRGFVSLDRTLHVKPSCACELCPKSHARLLESTTAEWAPPAYTSSAFRGSKFPAAPETRCGSSGTTLSASSGPKPETRNPKPETRNPKPETLTPIRNPKRTDEERHGVRRVEVRGPGLGLRV